MIPQTLSVNNLKAAIRNPHLFTYEIKRLLLGFKNGYRYGEGIDVMSEDWDNLIILDACRYDYFKRKNDFSGELQRVTSKGASSWEFVKHNYIGRHLHDTVAVTANPFYNRLSDDVFHAVRSVLANYDDEENQKAMGSIQNFHPQTVTEEARTAATEFPNKRLIIHYMQPHQPFIGPLGDKLREKVRGTKFERTGRKKDYIEWEAVTESVLTLTEVRDAYIENLKIVLEHVEELLDELGGKTVITADHGELLGEKVFGKRAWGHGFQKQVPEVRDVPWFVAMADNRRRTTSEDPVGMKKPSEKELSEQLEALGYK